MENISNVTENTENTDEQITTEQQEKTTYTKDEVEKMLQTETDRRISSAMKKAAADKAKAVAEAQKLAGMDADEKAKYQVEQMKTEYESKLQELALKENTATCKSILTDKGISPELAKYVVADTAEEMDSNIKEFEKYFKASVKAEVEKRMSGNNPKKNLGVDKPLDAKSFAKMSLTEQANLYATNPELYAQLTK